MKHENFKSFIVDGSGENSELNAFLNSNVTPKSISTSYVGFTNAKAVFIGYVESKRAHHYTIETETIDVVPGEDFDHKLNAGAARHAGVVCQDVHVSEGMDKLEVTWLVAK